MAMFESVLIANRGEIACRVLRTLKRLGIRGIALYSDVDAHAPHVALADEAYCIGGTSARSSYLDADKVLAVAARAGAVAIHPGYGFLSENAEFAELCAARGLRFIGPSPRAIRAMGLKDQAKALMEKAGVPVVPGYLGAAQDERTLAEAARAIGYPVLIKAVAGGGGKGMRRVDDPGDFADALAQARREAEAAFGDGRVLIEKYLSRPRHIELQVFGDRYGGALCLFERDCSIQRRHQKVLEEAPAPHLPETLRAELTAIATRAVKAIGYEGAGTIEMIADASRGLGEGRVYFMEMNTRLQVEHPVTEAVTGFDLVEWQLRVAAGEPLPCVQAEVPLTGHAIEVRLYAEDPEAGYLPQTGTLTRLELPDGEGVRVDAGVREGDAVTVHYDPMIAKIITHGPSRAVACARLRGALARTEVEGLRTNLTLLRRIAAHPAFAAGDVHTGFLEEHRRELLELTPERTAELSALLAASLWAERAAVPAAHPFDARDAFRPWASPVHTFDVRIAERDHSFSVRVGHGPLGELTLTVARDDGAAHTLRHVRFQAGRLSAELSGHMESARLVHAAQGYTLSAGSDVLRAEPVLRHKAGAGGEGGAATLRAPMPGRVTAVHVEAGAHVSRGAALVRLEAMKMEHTLRAAGDATVASLHVREGDQVSEGSVLVTLRAREE
jgi:3-methylcrotonyl-CoA carboxylase alpha subunit